MKKFVLVLLIALGLYIPTQSVAQLKFGLKGGLNVSTMSLNSQVFNTSNRSGFFFGPTIKFSLPLVGLGMDMAALYDERDYKLSADVQQTTVSTIIKQKQMVVPINLRYNIGLGEAAGIFLFAGPQFGFNIGDKSMQDQVAEWTLRSSNFSMNVGAGLIFFNHLQLSANYNVVFGKTGDVNAGEVIQNTYDQAVGKDMAGRGNSWQLALAYYF